MFLHQHNAHILLNYYKVVVHKEIHDVQARKCMMHASSTADTSIGRYNNEYALFLDFTEDGQRIRRIEEFADSAYSAKFFQRLQLSV